MPETLLKLQTNMSFRHRCFPMNFAKFSRTPILQNICDWLLLQPIFLSTLNSIRKNIFASLFSVHNTISLSRH